MTNIAKRLSRRESRTAFLTRPQSSPISKHSTVQGSPSSIKAWLISLAEDSHAKICHAPEKEQVSAAQGQGCFSKWLKPFAYVSPDGCSLKTSQCSLFEDSSEFSESLPDWGLMLRGALYRLPMSVRPTCVRGFGYWRTPNATDADHGGPNARDSKGGLHLSAQAARWPTPHRFSPDGKSNGPSSNELANGGSLNPTWVEKLMGWPKDWTCLNPISHVEYIQWLMGGPEDDTETRREEILRVLRKGNVAKEVQWEVGGFFGIPEATFLLSELCQYSDRPYQARVFLESAKTLEREMRGLRLQEGSSGPSSRPEQSKQRTGKYPDTMQTLSRLLAHYGKEAWQKGSWEDDIPRVVTGVANRVDRLRAIGNGQVPAVATTAFKLLSQLTL